MVYYVNIVNYNYIDYYVYRVIAGIFLSYRKKRRSYMFTW